MTLDEYLRTNGISEAAFAAAIGVTQPTVHRYRRGLRVPEPEAMRRIRAATGDLVLPNDFHAADMPPPGAGGEGKAPAAGPESGPEIPAQTEGGA